MHGQENYSQLKKILSIFYGNGVYYRSTLAKIRKVFKKIIIMFNFNTCTFKVLYFWHPNFLMQTNWNLFILYSFYVLLLNNFEFYRMAEIWIQSNNIIIFCTPPDVTFEFVHFEGQMTVFSTINRRFMVYKGKLPEPEYMNINWVAFELISQIHVDKV